MMTYVAVVSPTREVSVLLVQTLHVFLEFFPVLLDYSIVLGLHLQDPTLELIIGAARVFFFSHQS